MTAVEPAALGIGQIDLGPGVSVEILAADGMVFSGDAGALVATEAAHPGVYENSNGASPNDLSIALEISVGDFELFTAGDLSGAPGDPPYDDHTLTQKIRAVESTSTQVAASSPDSRMRFN